MAHSTTPDHSKTEKHRRFVAMIIDHCDRRLRENRDQTVVTELLQHARSLAILEHASEAATSM